MRKMLLGLVLILMTLSTSLQAEVPTQESVTKLYVATFNRAPDAAGLNYWLNDSGLQLEGIASSFFDQPETQEAYPPGSTSTEFVTAVYNNLFNREPEQIGLDYWVSELDSGSVVKSVFILAVINGAQDTELGNDATILENKTIVGLAFSNAGLDDTTDASEIMLGITDKIDTVLTALQNYNIVYSIPYSAKPISDEDKTAYLNAINAERAEVRDCGSYGVFQPAPPVTWSDELYKASSEHSYDMSVVGETSPDIAHEGSGEESDWTAQVLGLGRGSSPWERAENNGYDNAFRYSSGENVHSSPETVESVMSGWMASDGHCANIMNPNAREVGMAMVYNPVAVWGYYWTQLFGAYW